MKTNMLLVLVLLFALQLESKAQKKAIATVNITTSAQYAMCKKRIEEALIFEKGVKNAVLDIQTKNVVVAYDSTKTTETLIRQAINRVGYDADSLFADPKKYKRLPTCCKKPEDGGGH